MKMRREELSLYITGILGLMIFRILLDICYILIISKNYAYSGMTNGIFFSSYIYSWLFFLIMSPLVVVNYCRKTLSANIITLLSLISFVPTTSLMAFIPMSSKMLISMSIYWLLLLICNYFFPTLKIKLYKFKGNFPFWIILILLCFVVVYISGKFTKFRLHFGIFDVYKLRFEARTFNIPLILVYLESAANTILPLMLVYFMNKRKHILTIILAFIILLNFGIEGHKSVLFMLLFCFLGYWFYKFNRIKFFAWAFVALCFLTLLEMFIFKTTWTSSLYTYRLLYLPSHLHYVYYDFFSTHELDYFKQGVLRWFGATSSYKENIAFIIGDNYFKNPEVRANNGLFSDAYMNLGVLGVIVFPIIIVFFLKILDACAKGLNEKLLILPIVAVSIALYSTTFSTALLTAGLLLLLLLLYFMPRTSNKPLIGNIKFPIIRLKKII